MQTDLGVYSGLRNYFNIRLSAISEDQQKMLHKSRLYYHETSKNGNEVTKMAARDISGGKRFRLRGRLAGFTQHMYRLLPPNNSVEFKFTKAADDFYSIPIITHANMENKYKILIMEAKLHLKRVRLTTRAHEEFMARWRKERIYNMPYTRSEMIHCTITPGVRQHTIANVNMARVPQQLTLFFYGSKIGDGRQFCC